MDLDIRVHPRASCNSIEVSGGRPGVEPDAKIVVRVTAAPEGGKANDAVVALLAKRLRVPKRDVRIARGHKTRDKRVGIDGISPKMTLDRLCEYKK